MFPLCTHALSRRIRNEKKYILQSSDNLSVRIVDRMQSVAALASL